MLAVHKDLAFTIACGGKAFDTLVPRPTSSAWSMPAKKVAIGYCAGGGYVLEQARAGADFKAVVVFHVTNPNPVDPGTPCNIKGRVLAIHGSADPITPKPMMDAFEDGAHQGQGRLADDDVRPRRAFVLRPDGQRRTDAYDEKLCRKSYMLMREFFAETL